MAEVHRAEEILDRLAARQPELVGLARLASIAAIVEPPLLRRLRREVGHLVRTPAPSTDPWDAGLEADLWFSSLAHVATASQLTLRPEVLEVLRSQLADPTRRDEAEAAREVVTDAHRHHPEVIRLEERIIWSTVRGDTEDVADALRRALATLKLGPDRGTEIVRWYTQAQRRLPAAALQHDEGRRLSAAAAMHTDRLVPPELLAGDRFPDVVGDLAPASLPHRSIGVRIGDGGIHFVPETDPDAGVVTIPATRPLVVEITWPTTGQGEQVALISVEEGASRHLEGLTESAVIRTLTGTRFRIATVHSGALPRLWNTTARNPAFTGRGGDLSRLAEGLAAQGAVTVHSLRGMGGVGKTQLANEYCHTHYADYDVVWWIDAERPAMLADAFVGLATKLGQPADATDPAAVRAAVHAGLAGAGRWLLVFDNAESLDTIRAWAPDFPLAPGARGHVLVTTRRDGFDALGRVVDVDVLTPQESVTLIQTRVPDIQPGDAEQLADELGHLPLALEQAASYLKKSRLPAADYLDLLRTRTADMLTRGTVARREDVTIATLWDLSLQRLTGQSPAAVQLLHLCAYLGPDPIPEDLFTDHHEELPEPLAAAARDRLAFTDTRAALLDYALAKHTAAGIQVHRLVQAAVRAHPGPTTDPAADSDPLTWALALLVADAPQKIRGEPQDWPRWAVLLPHVIAATSHQTTPQTERDVSWLLDRAGTYLQVHGRPDAARPLLERALTIDEAAYGPDHPDVATDLGNLALVLRDLGDPAAARPLLERALTIDEAAYGPDHPDVATDLGNLAGVLRDLGDPAAARPLLERALTITEAAYGPDHPHSLQAMNNLGNLLATQIDPPDVVGARQWYERAAEGGNPQAINSLGLLLASGEPEQVLGFDSQLVCAHGGSVAVQHPDNTVIPAVITVDDVRGAPIVLCPNIGLNVKPCTVVLSIRSGFSEHVRRDGSPALLANVVGITDGTPPGVASIEAAFVRAPAPALIFVGHSDTDAWSEDVVDRLREELGSDPSRFSLYVDAESGTSPREPMLSLLNVCVCGVILLSRAALESHRVATEMSIVHHRALRDPGFLLIVATEASTSDRAVQAAAPYKALQIAGDEIIRGESDAVSVEILRRIGTRLLA